MLALDSFFITLCAQFGEDNSGTTQVVPVKKVGHSRLQHTRTAGQPVSGKCFKATLGGNVTITKQRSCG